MSLSAEEIAHHLGGRRTGSDQFRARGVCHDGSNPSSLAITQSGNDVLVYCHAGCPQDVVIDVLRGMGLWPEKGGKRKAFTPAPRAKRPVESCTSPTLDYARQIWKVSSDDDSFVSKHAYAVKKRITHAFGARRGSVNGRLVGKDADCVLVPNRDWDSNLVGVECINAEGLKQTFGNKGILVLGHPEGAEIIHVCEGWATAFAIAQLFPRPFACIVAFGKSAMERYARDSQVRFRGDIALHCEGDDNRDAWDLWNDGDGEAYAKLLMRRAYVGR